MQLQDFSQQYQEFLDQKKIIVPSTGIEANDAINPILFPFQRDITYWSLKKGVSAIFASPGLGKTFMQLEWGKHICNYTKGAALILTPLSVAPQTVEEGRKLDINVTLCRTQKDVRKGLNITNYDMLFHFNPDCFESIIIDESSILKSENGQIKTQVIESFKNTPYKLACTATPAPNDYMEIGNHAEFLGIMTDAEMKATFFVHDGGDTSKWRLKRHAVKRFWEWVASWAVMLRKPSDLGYSDEGFELPPLNIHQITLQVNEAPDGCLFPVEALTLQERQKARRTTIKPRSEECARIVNQLNEQCIIWCDLNPEAEYLKKILDDNIEVSGSNTREFKENAIIKFCNNEVKNLISKPSIFGFGLNLQHCCKMVFVGLSDSFERWYQAIRREWRFGQKNPVDVYVITTELEGAVVENIKRKERDFEAMLDGLISATQEITKQNISGAIRQRDEYRPYLEMKIPEWLKEEL